MFSKLLFLALTTASVAATDTFVTADNPDYVRFVHANDVDASTCIKPMINDVLMINGCMTFGDKMTYAKITKVGRYRLGVKAYTDKAGTLNEQSGSSGKVITKTKTSLSTYYTFIGTPETFEDLLIRDTEQTLTGNQASVRFLVAGKPNDVTGTWTAKWGTVDMGSGQTTASATYKTIDTTGIAAKTNVEFTLGTNKEVTAETFVKGNTYTYIFTHKRVKTDIFAIMLEDGSDGYDSTVAYTITPESSAAAGLVPSFFLFAVLGFFGFIM